MTTASYKVIIQFTQTIMIIIFGNTLDQEKLLIKTKSTLTHCPPTWHHGHPRHGGDAPDVVDRDRDIGEGHGRLLTTGVPGHRGGQAAHHRPRHGHHLVTLTNS